MACRLAHYFCLMSQSPCHLSNQKRDRYRMFPWTYYKSFSFSRGLLFFFLIKKLSHCPPYFCPHPRWFHSGEVIVQGITVSQINRCSQAGPGRLSAFGQTLPHTQRRLKAQGDPGVFSFFLWLDLTRFPVFVLRKEQVCTWSGCCRLSSVLRAN